MRKKDPRVKLSRGIICCQTHRVSQVSTRQIGGEVAHSSPASKRLTSMKDGLGQVRPGRVVSILCGEIGTQTEPVTRMRAWLLVGLESRQGKMIVGYR